MARPFGTRNVSLCDQPKFDFSIGVGNAARPFDKPKMYRSFLLHLGEKCAVINSSSVRNCRCCKTTSVYSFNLGAFEDWLVKETRSSTI